MISYDAFSLFTSIPLKETIDIAINLMFDKYPDLKISRQDRKKSFEFATSATYIFFLIAVIMIKLMELRWIFFTTCLSSLFMYFHEKKWLDQFQFCDVLLYRRYVDDIICFNRFFTNFVSFTPYFYKIGLIKTFIHRTYKISSSWTSFNEEIFNFKHLLMKNMHPSYLIGKQVKRFLHNKFSTNYWTAVTEFKTTL